MGSWDMQYYERLFGLVQNRADVINAVLGVDSPGAAGSPCIVTEGRVCQVVFCGRVLVEWGRWDVAGIERALALVSAVDRAMWDARRMGYVRSVRKETANAHIG